MRIPVTLTAIALALGIVVAANSQVYKPGGGSGSGGGITAGTTSTTGCGAAGVLFSSSSLVQCDTGFTYAGSGGAVGLTGILQLPDTTSATVGVIQFGGARFVHDTGATSNVFVGHNSANLTTTGTQNVAVGESAGLALAAGSNNTFVGRFAGGGVTSGASNVAVGTGAFSSGANAGGSNVAIGSGANATTNSNTVAVGASALAANAGAGTTAVGFQAGNAATGATNTFVGNQSGNTVVAGASNTFLGSTSGTAITTTSGNTIIGQGCTGTVGDAATVQIGNAGCAAFMDFGKTTAATWSFGGALAATLVSTVGTNVVCNTPGTKTVITVQVSATGCAASSARFKEGIASIDKEQALSDVMHFQPVSYTYKPEFNMGSDKHVGFTAEQIGSVDPQWITYEADGVTPHAVKYNEMAPLLAAAIQALKADNDNLRAELEDLKRRVH